jgi:hypothetical protein
MIPLFYLIQNDVLAAFDSVMAISGQLQRNEAKLGKPLKRQVEV